MDWAIVPREVIDGDELPPVCIVCGRRSTTKVHKTFEYRPDWVDYLYFAGFVPGMVADHFITQQVRVACPVCDEHRGHWSRLVWFASLGWLIPVLLGAAGFAIAVPLTLEDGLRLLGMFLGGLTGIAIYGGVVVRLAVTRIRVSRITPLEVRFERVSEEFARAAVPPL